MAVDSSKSHPADRLLGAIEHKRAPVCVGLDPVLERLPHTLNRGSAKLLSPDANRIFQFCLDVIDAVAPWTPCIKIQSACMERFGTEGSVLLALVAEYARTKVEVILDAKRGDIGVSAEHYAAAAFEARNGQNNTIALADWLTINAYLGEDGIEPFLKRQGHGAFALVRTSNPGGDAIQNLQLKDGRTVAHAVAELIAQIGSKHVGKRGYSALGAVVGATKREDARRLREIMPQQIFLLPGYGAQGGGVDDVLPGFKSDGTGAIVTASRSVIYAFEKNDRNWTKSVSDAAAALAEDIGRAVGLR